MFKKPWAWEKSILEVFHMLNQSKSSLSQSILSVGAICSLETDLSHSSDRFIDHFVNNNPNVCAEDQGVLTDYIRSHPGVWNHPSNIESVEEFNHRVTIHHKTGDVHISMPASHN
jgi:hypothetical protein